MICSFLHQQLKKKTRLLPFSEWVVELFVYIAYGL